MEGALWAGAGRWVVAVGTPIPSAVDPGRVEQTRHRASRSFVQWRAPPLDARHRACSTVCGPTADRMGVGVIRGQFWRSSGQPCAQSRKTIYLLGMMTSAWSSDAMVML